MPHYLKNSNLRVLIGNPMEFYGGPRFDHSGNILQVNLNNLLTFCTTEKPDFSSMSGFGLINEFDIELPQGYNETPVGERFHKIGVGNLLKLDNRPYDFFRSYNKEPLEYSIEKTGDNLIAFQAVSQPLETVFVEYRKVISIKENELTIDYLLVNKGKVKLKTSEYCHNFLALNKAPINSDYRLEFGFEIEPDQFEAVHNIESFLKFDKSSVGFKATPNGDIFIRKVNGINKANYWQLTNHVQKCGVREEVSFDATLVNLWGNSHVISPELFCDLEIEPGESAAWWRKYTFFKL